MTKQILRGLGAFLSLACLFAACPLRADVQLPALLSDRMVLQRDVPLRFWGVADPGEAVTVRLRGVERSTSADPRGKWEVFLPPQPAGQAGNIIISGRNQITLQDVLIGDVWVASGQSNMEWPLRLSLSGNEEAAAAICPNIRLFKVAHRIAEAPMDDVSAEWKECSPATLPGFSAVAYFFGRDLQSHLKVPVGLIQAARGGTPAEAWTGREELLASPDLSFYLTKWSRLFQEFPEASKRYEVDMQRWEQSGKVASQRPRAPLGPGSAHVPSGLFNGMIAPLTPFAIRGVIWYQGETNASRAESRLYRTLFPAMIEGWRDRWGIGRFPFLFVQLANYEGPGTGPGTEWPELREAQRYALARVPQTGMAVTIDVGDAQDIHPKDKRTVGQRLALAARAVAYQEPVESHGPQFVRATAEASSLRVWFSGATALRARSGMPLRGFSVAGPDKVFEASDARIEGNTVVVSSPKVARPVAVRYAWADNPDANLESGAGLPASPFRSDNWTDALMRRSAPLPQKALGILPVFGSGGWSATPDPALPNVLILGDSISIGYTREVRHLLKGQANIFRPVDPAKDTPINCRSTAQGLLALDEWIGATKWSVIHFNFGLHDLAYRNSKLDTPGQLDRVNGTVSIPPPQYEKNLSELLIRLKRSGACLVWASTTVIPPGELGRFTGDEYTYNSIAARLLLTHSIPVNDLHALSSTFAPSLFVAPGNVHFGAEANWMLAHQTAEAISAALLRCGGAP